MPTIKDVARRAGVSVTAASYALNRTGTISEETRQRVLQAAEELNYHPNAFARHLKARRSLTIGVFITRFAGAFYEEILDGIHEVILATDYELIVCPETRVERRIFTHRQVDGAIVFDTSIPNEQILRLAGPKFPIVVMDRYLENKFVFPILLDNRQGVVQAFNHLYRQGLRRLAYIAGAPDSFDNNERMQAFLNEATRHHLSLRVYPGNFTEQSGYDAARAIIADGDLPEAVFCANDQMAIGFIRAMHEHGLEAPRDIAVVGCDDIQIARYVQPPLSTIGASRREWGGTAAKWLMRYIEHEETSPPQRIPTTFIVRASSLKRPELLE
ncbi:MAG TPA: LacI family transcriptional regulator [Chloroflexus aurantiacus]|jgi:LacI family transcriptional regulator|uniref:Alanine racemase n=1 Tax=Chloroflexus aurantiacus (strain ATCC 29366 / DSM 635 / J-10-fl) TaxID=324602 RepID=A9WCT1_CHLAA|nr:MULTISPECIES: LacI family DNA-binding transcriptional regulator [Chloroflexus]ABY37043.1 Alanine racemase [Chloroflexus aurantiacus J-10-fl]GIV93179.1 MAG: LacI family transcriptional regulator [Chloroflexus sp.]HBW66462.1 LacI family transcriptional regulator [Chloroflexus aurantiacus]